MRLGAPVFNFKTPAEWAREHVRKGYGAAYWPLPPCAPAAERDAFAGAAADHDIVIAEVGVWNNPLASDPAHREAAIRDCVAKLRVADAVGARCCVNIAGSRSPTSWMGAHPDNLTPETFDMIVRTTRRILDEAAPARSFYTLECMQWVFPCDVASMRRLLDAVAHPRFAVHLDMCNLTNMPERVFFNAQNTRAWFDAFGPLIRSIHAKDVVLRPEPTVHIDEALPGRGHFDFATLLQCASARGDIPVMCEHLATEAEYDEAAAHLRKVAASLGLKFTAAV